jgi:coatomer subunit beta'
LVLSLGFRVGPKKKAAPDLSSRSQPTKKTHQKKPQPHPQKNPQPHPQQVLEGHSHNLSAVAFHPELPILITGSEDGAVRLWHSTTYRLENTLSLGLERCWSVSVLRGSNAVAVGYDEGVAVLKVGREEPVASMDGTGKIVWARHSEVHGANVRALGGEAAAAAADGERLPLASKELGSTDAYPQSLRHSPNGRFVACCGDGEYVVYTALAWRSKAFGPALEFVWSTAGEGGGGAGGGGAGGAADFATREAGARVKIFRNFAERLTLTLDFVPEGIHGGALLGARGPDYVVFYDWATGGLVRRVDVGGAVRDVVWSESGDQVAVVGDGAFFVLRLDRNAVDQAMMEREANGGGGNEEDGVDDAFELVAEVPERARTALWVGDALVYTNAAWRLQYCVGGEAATLAHLDRPLYLIGYLAAQSRVYLIGRDHSVVSYSLPLPLIGFKAALLRDDAAAAFALLPSIPQEQHAAAAKFLESKGLLREALEVSQDPDHRFDLAVQLGELETAQSVAEALDAPSKWRQLGEMALGRGILPLARACLSKGGDLSGLLLLHASLGDVPGLLALAEQAESEAKLNVAFACRLLLSDVDACVALLQRCGRLPEAALFARAYAPSKVGGCVEAWRADLAKLNARAAESLADPAGYPNLFPGFGEALELEAARRSEAAQGGGGGFVPQAAAAAPAPKAAAAVSAAVAAAAAAAPVVEDKEEEQRQQREREAEQEARRAREEQEEQQAAARVAEEEQRRHREEAEAAERAAAERAAAAAKEEEEELFQDTHQEEAAAPPPPPPPPAPQQQQEEEDDDFGLDDEPAVAAAGGAPAAAAAPAGAAAAAPADDLNLDDDWGLDEE